MYYIDASERSSLISEIEYHEDTKELHIYFKKYYIDHVIYVGVSLDYFMAFSRQESLGKFYLSMIKPKFSQKRTTMADKIIKCKINVRDINKEWLFTGEKGVYLNFTLLFNEEQDGYGNNGMLVQDVPTAIYKKEKEEKLPPSKGVILGNAKMFEKTGAGAESAPGKESGQMGKPAVDDLPF